MAELARGTVPLPHIWELTAVLGWVTQTVHSVGSETESRDQGCFEGLIRNLPSFRRFRNDPFELRCH